MYGPSLYGPKFGGLVGYGPSLLFRPRTGYRVLFISVNSMTKLLQTNQVRPEFIVLEKDQIVNCGIYST